MAVPAGHTGAVAEAGAAWERRFDALETEVHRTRRDRRARPTTGAGTAAAATEREERSA